MVCCGWKRSTSARAAEAFESFYADHEPELYGYLARRLDPTTAEAVAAECFALAWDGFATRDRSVSGQAWLFGLALDRLRARRHDELAYLDHLAHTKHGRDDRDSCAHVAAALAQLDATDRDMLTLHVWAGVSHESVASLMGLSTRIVERRVSGAYEFVQRKACKQ